MREGITVEVSAADRARLEAIVNDRNSAQKHVWRARIVLLTADGVGTNEIMLQTGTSKVTVWRWQERFMAAGVAGLLRDKTRPSRILALPTSVRERVVALTLGEPPDEATHWTAAMMAQTIGISVSSVQRIWRRDNPTIQHRVGRHIRQRVRGSRSVATNLGTPRIVQRVFVMSRHHRQTIWYICPSCPSRHIGAH